MRKIALILLLTAACFGTVDFEVGLIDTFGNFHADTTLIDSLCVGGRYVRDTVITSGWAYAGKWIGYTIGEPWQDSSFTATPYASDDLISFAVPYLFDPATIRDGDTLLAELVSDSIPIPTDQLDSIAAYVNIARDSINAYTSIDGQTTRDKMETIHGHTQDTIRAAYDDIISHGDINWLTATGFATTNVDTAGLLADILAGVPSVGEIWAYSSRSLSAVALTILADTFANRFGDCSWCTGIYTPLAGGVSSAALSATLSSSSSIDIELPYRNTLPLSLTVLDSDADTVDITGDSLWIVVKSEETSADTLILKAFTLTAPTSGIATAELTGGPGGDTDALDCGETYIYDIHLLHDGTQYYSVVFGSITIRYTTECAE